MDVILSKKRKTKALIRLRGCAGWSAPLLFATLRRQVFPRRGPFDKCSNRYGSKMTNSTVKLLLVLSIFLNKFFILSILPRIRRSLFFQKNVQMPWQFYSLHIFLLSNYKCGQLLDFENVLRLKLFDKFEYI